MIIYGDDLANVKLAKINDIYNKNKKQSNSYSLQEKSQYGHLKVNANGRVTKFIEKPPYPYPINIGFYFINKDVFKKIL